MQLSKERFNSLILDQFQIWNLSEVTPKNHDRRNGEIPTADRMAFVIYLAFILPINDWSDNSSFDTGIKVNPEVPESLQESANNIMRDDVLPISSIEDVLIIENQTLTIGNPTAPYINDFAVQLDQIEAQNDIHGEFIHDNFGGNNLM